MKKIVLYIVLIFFLIACKRDYNAQPTYSKQAIAGNWAKSQPFYQPSGERFDETTNTWRAFKAFTVTSDADPDKLSFANPYVAGRGTNALDMNRLYASQDLTSDSGYYNITIPKLFQFIPDAKDPLQGTVIVLEQDVKIYRKDKSSFIIHVSPGSAPGTYDVNTNVFEIEITFNETSISGGANVKRKYRFTA